MTVGYKTIFWQCGIGREKIFVGFTVEVENREEYNDICNSVEFKDLRRMVEIVDPIYKQGISFPLMWKFVVPELNFKAFDQLIFDMTDNNKLSKMIEDTIACQADEEITKMKKLIREA